MKFVFDFDNHFPVEGKIVEVIYNRKNYLGIISEGILYIKAAMLSTEDYDIEIVQEKEKEGVIESPIL